MKKYIAGRTIGEDTKLWRYMDLSRFVSLITEESLFFSPASSFRDDDLEGQWYQGDAKAIEAALSTRSANPSQSLSDLMTIQDYVRRATFISCWTIEQQESSTLWKRYGDNTVVVLQTTVGRLESSILKDSEHMWQGPVAYNDKPFDYPDHPAHSPWKPLYSLVDFFFRKRTAYQAEQEYRVLCSELTDGGSVEINKMHKEIFSKGVEVKVKLDVLIEKFIVAPNTEEWVIRSMRAILSRFGIDVRIEESALSRAVKY